MASDNRISITITPAQLDAVNAAAMALEAALSGLTTNLGEEDKKRLPKIGDKTLAFDEKCKAYMADRPDLVPAFTDMAEVQTDRDLIAALLPFLRQLEPIVSDLENTILLAYSDLYVADLAFYQNVKQAARRGVNGADAIYGDLKERFPGRPRSEEPPAPPESLPAP